MFATIQKCQLNGCNRATSTKCFCCHKNVCTKHFMEHIDAVKIQIDPLANEINQMVEELHDLTVDKITQVYFAQLQQWRMDMHQQIDEIFLAKTKEIEELIATNKEKFVEHRKQQLENVTKLQDQVRQLVENEDATAEQIQLLRNQITIIQTNLTSFQKNFLSVNTRELVQELITILSNLNKSASSSSVIHPQCESNQTSVLIVRGKRKESVIQIDPVFSMTPVVQTQAAVSFNPTTTPIPTSSILRIAPVNTTPSSIGNSRSMQHLPTLDIVQASSTSLCNPYESVIQSNSITPSTTSTLNLFGTPTVTTAASVCGITTVASSTASLSPTSITFTFGTSSMPAATIAPTIFATTTSTAFPVPGRK